ncbi:MAG: hypothetical protein WC527_05765 [Candidatus Margulisiibacteriota bacterium]
MAAMRSIIDAIPAAHQGRFVTAAQIRRSSGIPEQLQLRNFDSDFQHGALLRGLQKSIGNLDTKANSIRFIPDLMRPDSPEHVMLKPALKLLDLQQLLMELDNRLQDKDFVPLARADMPPITHGILKPGDPRLGTAPLFSSPAEFLSCFEEGLSMWAQGEDGYGSVGVLDVGGGAGARAAKELASYYALANRYRVTAQTPRALYPVMDTQSTFKGVIMDIVHMFSKHLGVETPVFAMISSEKAPHFVDHVRNHPESSTWQDNVVFWNQRVLERYDLEEYPIPLDGDFPAGHGDAAILGYRYGMYEALKALGVKHVANANGDEFLWYYMYPALLSKMSKLEATMFMLSVANANNQMAGFFGNGLQIETPCIPFGYVAAGIAPEILNTTFTGMELDTLLKGAAQLESTEEKVNVIVKGTWWNSHGKQKLMNIVGHDSWMGDVFSRQNMLGGGRMVVPEVSRNLFLGLKGPQHAFDKTPQGFLGGVLGYGNFYTMMAIKSKQVLQVLLGSDQAAKMRLAEQLFRHNFELINIEI